MVKEIPVRFPSSRRFSPAVPSVWFADEGVADRYAVLLPALDVLRSRGVPVPEYPFVRAVDGWTLSAQQVLPGRSFPTAPPKLVDRMIECVSAAAGIVGPQPAPALQGWGEFVIHTLTVGENGWAEHDSLRAQSDRARPLAWAGLANTYFWIDRTKRGCGYDDTAIDTLGRFETAVYQGI